MNIFNKMPNGIMGRFFLVTFKEVFPFFFTYMYSCIRWALCQSIKYSSIVAINVEDERKIFRKNTSEGILLVGCIYLNL